MIGNKKKLLNMKHILYENLEPSFEISRIIEQRYFRKYRGWELSSDEERGTGKNGRLPYRQVPF